MSIILKHRASENLDQGEQHTLPRQAGCFRQVEQLLGALTITFWGSDLQQSYLMMRGGCSARMMLAAVLPVSWTESGEKAIVPVNEKLTPRNVSRYAYYHVDMEVAKMLGAVDIVRHTNCEYHRCVELARSLVR